MIKENFMIRGWLIQKHSTATQPKLNSVIDFAFSLFPAATIHAAIHVKSVSRQWDPMEGVIGGRKKQSALKGIHILPFILAWIYIWIDSHCTPGSSVVYSWLGDPATKLHLQRCSGLNLHTPNLHPIATWPFPILLAFICHITFSQSHLCSHSM